MDVSLTLNEYNNLRFKQLPWIEKYRPQTINEVILADNLKQKAAQFIKKNIIQNLILTGPPGIGKTTTIRCIARGLYGKYYNNCVLELNASDDRGIKSVQDAIIKFCKFINPYKKEDMNKYCKHKLIILDESDNMMEKAQYQINTLMEKYSNNIRFAFTCNSSSDIIEAIQSRCLILRYTRLTNLQIFTRLEELCIIEKLKYEKLAIEQIAEMSRGDMRGSINILQLVHNKHNAIKLEYIKDICDIPQSIIIKNIFNYCISSQLNLAIKLMLQLKNEGYSGSDITLSMIYTLKSELCNDIPESLKIKMLYKICNSTYYISKTIDTNLQLMSCLAELSLINMQ